MPEIKSRIAFGLARGVKAFLNFDMGLVRGEAPNPEQQLRHAQTQLERRDQQFKRIQKRFRTKLEERDRRIKQMQKRLDAGAQKPGPVRHPSAAEAKPKYPEWFRAIVGGRWEEIGKLQFDFLREQGLRAEHRFLDVGCGSLRGGVHFIPYLEAGHYYGIDKDESLLNAGWTQIEEANLQERRPTLVHMGDFGFERLGQTFDYALAQSVFTHLPLNLINRCLINIDRVLRPGGVFFATFFENWNGKWYLEPLMQGDGIISYHDEDPFHYTPDAFEWACRETSLDVEYIGDWNHPRNQLMLAFRKTA